MNQYLIPFFDGNDGQNMAIFKMRVMLFFLFTSQKPLYKVAKVLSLIVFTIPLLAFVVVEAISLVALRIVFTLINLVFLIIPPLSKIASAICGILFFVISYIFNIVYVVFTFAEFLSESWKGRE
jgi:hypothetical protein